MLLAVTDGAEMVHRNEAESLGKRTIFKAVCTLERRIACNTQGVTIKHRMHFRGLPGHDLERDEGQRRKWHEGHADGPSRPLSEAVCGRLSEEARGLERRSGRHVWTSISRRFDEVFGDSPSISIRTRWREVSMMSF